MAKAMTVWRRLQLVLAVPCLLAAAATASAAEPRGVQLADELYANGGAAPAQGDEFNANGGTGGPMYGAGQYGRDPECRSGGKAEGKGTPAATPRLAASADGRVMLTGALALLKAAPPGRRVAMFQDFAAQIAAATRGSWSAKRVDLPDGDVVFAGELGQSLVFDRGGNMLGGSLKNVGTGPDAQFQFGPNGTPVPNDMTLRPIL